MRNYNSKDLAPQVACVTVKMFERTHSAKYSGCKTRNDLPYETGYVYTLIPIERLACDALLEFWGIANDNSAPYVNSYAEAAEILSSPLNDAAQRLPTSAFSDDIKKKILNSIKVVDNYQKELKKRGLDFPEPFTASSDLAENAATSAEKAIKESPLKTLKEFINEKPELSSIQLFFEMLSSKNEPTEVPVKAPAFPLPPVKVGPYLPENDKVQETVKESPATPASSVPVEFEEEEVEFTIDEVMAGRMNPSVPDNTEEPFALPQPETVAPVAKDTADVPQEPEKVPYETPVEAPIATSPALEKKEEKGFEEIDFNALISADYIFGSSKKKDEVSVPTVETTAAPVATESPTNNPAENKTAEIPTTSNQGFIFEPIDDIDEESDEEEDIYAGLFNS